MTHNEAHFLALHRAWRDWFAEWGPVPPPPHRGIVVISQPPKLSIEVAATLIDRFLATQGRGAAFANRFFRWSVGRGREELA